MLSQLIELLSILTEKIFLSFGASGIVVIALLENIFPPTPSEILYPLAGKMAYDGNMSLLNIILAGTFGSLIGAIGFYYLGYIMGEARIRHFIRRHGTFKIWRLNISLFTIKRYDRAAHAFKEHGGIIVMVARLMPFIHGIISIPAGVMQMNLLAFITYTFIGSALWISPTVLLGYFLGSHWDTVLTLLDAYEHLWYVVIVFGVAYYIISKKRQKHAEARTNSTNGSYPAGSIDSDYRQESIATE